MSLDAKMVEVIAAVPALVTALTGTVGKPMRQIAMAILEEKRVLLEFVTGIVDSNPAAFDEKVFEKTGADLEKRVAELKAGIAKIIGDISSQFSWPA